jgi:hypothetical protein
VVTREHNEKVMRNAPPPTEDDVTITWDGRAINTKEKLLAWLEEVEALERAGVTSEDIRRWQGGVPGWAHIDWDWDPVKEPRV